MRIAIALGIITLGTVGALLANSAPGFAEPIAVEGNRASDAAAIRSAFHVAAGKGAAVEGTDVRFLPAAIDAAIKELYATGRFEDVTVKRSEHGLIVTVVEAPMVERVQFEGNRKFKDKDFAAAVTLQPHRPATRAAVQAEVAQLTEFYRRNGFYEASITPKTIAHREGSVDLVFEIDEGGKTGIRRIVFSGNRAFTDYRLKGLLTTAESGWLAFLGSRADIYDADRLEADGERLRQFYRARGFADIRLTGSGRYDPALAGFLVSFAIEEGERYRLGTVEIVSHVPALDAAALRPALHLAPGAVYNGDAVAKAADAIALAAARNNRPFATVRAQLSRDAHATVDVTFLVEEGPHLYVERIAIRGNTKTRDDVIRREFDFAEGDAYDRNALVRAERRLKALHLFKSVKTATAPGSAADRIVLNVDIEEDQTGSYSFSGGYGTADGFVGEISLAEQNLRGTNESIKATATLGQYLRGASLAFTEPYFLDQRLSLGLEGSFREALSNPYQSYGSTTYGGTVRLGAPLTDEIATQVHYSLMNEGVSVAPCSSADPPPGCLAASNASAAVKQAVLDGPLWISSAGVSATYSTLDDARHPSEGVRATLGEDVAGLGGAADFLKNTADMRLYHDLGEGVVAVAHAQGGAIEPYGTRPLPLQSGFFGGPQLVRGFAPNGLGPRDVTPGTAEDNIGGTAYWATSAELQAPIPGLPPEIALRAAGFADAGSLWGYRGATSFPALSQSLTVADTRQIRSSLGAGLIWDSPFGAMRADYAVPVTKAPYDVTRRLYFGVGPF